MNLFLQPTLLLYAGNALLLRFNYNGEALGDLVWSWRGADVDHWRVDGADVPDEWVVIAASVNFEERQYLDVNSEWSYRVVGCDAAGVEITPYSNTVLYVPPEPEPTDNSLTDGDGNILTDENGNILTP